eukprot:288442_1
MLTYKINISMMLTGLLISWLATVIASNPIDLPVVFIGNGGYVRTAQLPNKNVLSCNGGGAFIHIYQKSSTNNTWNPISQLKNPAVITTGTDFGNCFLYSSTHINNKIILATRFHTGCNDIHCLYYSIRVWISTDNGKTWKSNTNNTGYIVDELTYTQQSNSNCGLWEPFIYEIYSPSNPNNISLNIYYSKEYLDSKHSKQQNIVQKTSIDEGITWTQTIIASSSGSRDGMPAVTQFIDGTVFLSMEMPWPINSGHFRTSVIKSYDGGLTYPESTRQYILCPNAPWQSSSSGIAFSNKTGTIVVTSMLDNGLSASEEQYVVYSDSFDGYHWKTFTLVNTQHGFWPNVYVMDDDLYVEFNSNGKSYTTLFPVNNIPQNYVAMQYGISNNDQDIGGNYSPLKNVASSYDCHINCLELNKEECVAFNYDSQNKNCWLKNGVGSFILPNPPVYNVNAQNQSEILYSRWYYGTNTDGVGLKNVNNINTKEQCLFECLTENECKQIIWNNYDNICYMKSTLPTVFTSYAIDTYLWIVPELTILNRGQFVSNLNGDTMTVDKNGMRIYSHTNQQMIANVPAQLVYNGDFTWKFNWGVINMIYDQNGDSWDEHGGGNVVWKRVGLSDYKHKHKHKHKNQVIG